MKEETTADWPWGEATREEFEESMAEIPERWGKGRGIAFIAPSVGHEPRVQEWWGRLQIQSATPRAAESFMRMAFEIDVRHVLPSVHVPTLVVHRAGDAVCHVENGRYLARHVEGARYVELPGDDHASWVGENADELMAEVQELLTGVREPVEPERVLATVLFTDIAGSTERASALGDRGWRELLERHHALVRGELARHRGREIDTAGDGFFAAFDGPARGIRCAQAIVGGVRSLGLEVRAGPHTGECEVLGRKLGGIAVHIGARVAALAGPGEVVVSGTVRDLISGSGIEFEDRGLHRLKGLDGEWAVLAARP